MGLYEVAIYLSRRVVVLEEEEAGGPGRGRLG